MELKEMYSKAFKYYTETSSLIDHSRIILGIYLMLTRIEFSSDKVVFERF
jgi:hypothetical protein